VGLLAILFAGVLVLPAADEYRWDLPKGFPKPRVPSDNPMSDAKVQLGRYLFYDQHFPSTASNPAPVVTGRNSPSRTRKDEPLELPASNIREVP